MDMTKVKMMYDINCIGKDVIINEPAYINIKNASFDENDTVIYIKNNMVTVTLWKKINRMHVTLLY